MKLSARKIGAVAASVCLLVFVLLSWSALILHAGHHCTEEHCEICACLKHARAALRSLGRLPAGLAGGLPAGLCLVAVMACCLAVRRLTPVRLRVRMDT